MTMPVITVFTCAAIALLLSLDVASSPLAAQGSGGPRDATHLIYDAGQHRLLLLASSRESGLEEIWRWDGSRWTRGPGSGPPARHLGGAAYDTRRRRLVLQGGMGPSPGNDRKGDTWEWDGTTWRSISATSIGPRDHHAMAYDEARGRMVLFGGASSNEELAGDTWEYDGTTWTRVATDGPPGRAHFGMAYDATSQRWHLMAYDESLGRTILYGGSVFDGKVSTSYYDTWAWDGEGWTLVSR